MTENYYFLVAGLPEPDLESPEKGMSFPLFADLAKEHLSPADVALFETIQLPIDIINLAALMDKSTTPFREGGLYEKEKLQTALHDPSFLPPYMQPVMEAWRSDAPIFHNITWEDQLHWFFYEAMEAISCDFLKNWFFFDVTLKNLIAVISCSESNIPLERRMAERIEDTCSQAVITRNETAEAIVDSTASDFSLPPIFPDASLILSLDRRDLVHFEKTIDRIRWDWLDAATAHHYFSIEFIIAYGLKSRIMDRWKKLTPQAGRERFEALIQSLENACDGASLQKVIS